MSPETPQRIEPARLEDVPERLADLLAEVASAASRLGHGLHPQTAASLAAMVRIMNCYYSNVIEGHHTRPRDIEHALGMSPVHPRQNASPASTREIESAVAGSLMEEDRKRDLLTEAVAHVRVQEKIDELHRQGNLPEPASADFLRYLHREFYHSASEAMLTITSGGMAFRMTPGEWRNASTPDIAVGRHHPPSGSHVADFMSYFAERFRFEKLGTSGRILALASAHHRFNYIHPFPDGNGRVSRLMSHAMGHAAGIGAHGLWSVSRGLARGLASRDEYKLHMDQADLPRQGDLDGRGNLSLQSLVAFNDWFMRVCLDQIEFMESLFDLTKLQSRLRSLVVQLEDTKPEAAKLLEEALMRGEFPRGEAARISGLPERSARRVLSGLEGEGLLVSDTPKGPVHLRFPAKTHEILFPRLFLPETKS